MTTILDTNNVFNYLASINYCNELDRDISIITVISAKNFNLLISFAVVHSYLDGFPKIISERSDYLERAIQFAGLSLIQRVEISIDEKQIFDNQGIIMMQVAKQLICCTDQTIMKTLFGSEFTQFIN